MGKNLQQNYKWTHMHLAFFHNSTCANSLGVDSTCASSALSTLILLIW